MILIFLCDQQQQPLQLMVQIVVFLLQLLLLLNFALNTIQSHETMIESMQRGTIEKTFNEKFHSNGKPYWWLIWNLHDILYMVEDFQRESLNYLPCFDYGNISNHFHFLHNAIELDNFVKYFVAASWIQINDLESPIPTIMMLLLMSLLKVQELVVFQFQLQI